MFKSLFPAVWLRYLVPIFVSVSSSQTLAFILDAELNK